MVHNESEKPDCLQQLRWHVNQPFSYIPPDLIKQLGNPMTHVKYNPGVFYHLAPWYDKMPMMWNLMGEVDGEVKVAAWGHLDPMSGGLYVQHFVADKSIQAKTKLWDLLIEELWKFARSRYLWFIWIITYHPKAMIRLMKHHSIGQSDAIMLYCVDPEVENGRLKQVKE